MAIFVEGQYYLEARLGGRRDFLTEDDLEEFILIEKAGNSLPAFELKFTSSESVLISELNEGNALSIQIGRTREELADINLKVVDLKSYRSANSEYTFIATGILNHIPYTNNPEVDCTDRKSGVQVIKEVVENYGFKFQANISSSRESQNWVRPNITGKKFVSKVAMHSFLNDSFIATGITSDSRFILKDIRKEIKDKNSEPDWRLVKGSKNENDITYGSNYVINNFSGFMNATLANGKRLNISDIENASYGSFKPELNPIIALTREIARSQDMTEKFAGTELKTGNVHTNYWKAKQINLTNLALLSSFKLTVPCGEVFFPIRVLDLVYFKESDTAEPSQANEYLTGLYFVSKVIRRVSDKGFTTTIEICRESPNLVVNNVD